MSDTFKYIERAYLYGENKIDIGKVLDNINIKYHLYKTLSDVIDDLPLKDNSKKIILFSPASPSVDQFDSYLERGNTFNNLIDRKIGKI